MTIGIVAILAIVAGVLAAVDLFQTQGRDLAAWGVLILAIALVISTR